MICFSMDEAFYRLTIIQQNNVNKQMFEFAYSCVVKSKGDQDALVRIIQEETNDYKYLEADLKRYCKLVQRVM